MLRSDPPPSILLSHHAQVIDKGTENYCFILMLLFKKTENIWINVIMFLLKIFLKYLYNFRVRAKARVLPGKLEPRCPHLAIYVMLITLTMEYFSKNRQSPKCIQYYK